MNRKSYSLKIGLILVGALILAALLSPLIPFDPFQMDLAESLEGPTRHHIFGMDQDGIDLLSEVLYGARLSLAISISTVIISLIIGIFAGSVSGYFGGIADHSIMRVVDILLAFPGILLAIAIAAILGPGIQNVVIALSITGWVTYARLVRGQMLSLKEKEYVQAAQTIGATNKRIILRHLLPNMIGPLSVQASFSMAGVIIAESSLSFLGLGAPPGTPSWGALLDQGKDFLIEAPHIAMFPGIAIMLTVLGFNLLGEGLRDRFDPKRSA